MALSTLGATVSCGGAAPEPAVGAHADLDAHVATYEPMSDAGDSALLEGRVRILKGCLVVASTSGPPYFPVFPVDEVGWFDGRLVYDGRSYAAGEAISLSGGATRTSGASVPAACEGRRGLAPWTVAPDS